ncbi:Uma2 family endonuclease [Armatimonas sp.]|uniref:Uma2 family endonuclease n=1 Tax=Armatimonas sp. TaxID=1872638 RepID=UPI00374CEA81
MSANPAPFRWSIEAYERIVAFGGFSPETQVELIEGELLETKLERPELLIHRKVMSRMIPIVQQWLSGHCIFCQGLFHMGDSVPHPDLAVVLGEMKPFLTSRPTIAVLIIEISDTTLRYDQTTKAIIYAAAGIGDYWIVNINERTVEIRRQPGPSGYRSLQTYTETDTIAPLFNPTASIAVAELLP